MAEFTHEVAERLLASCQSGSEEAAAAFGRAFDGEFTVAAELSEPPPLDALPAEWQGPGLAFWFTVGDASALLLLPESTGLLPAWCAEPDATGKSKLATVAQELGVILFPEEFQPSEARTDRVADLANTFSQSDPTAEISCLQLTLTRGEQLGVASLIWPLPASTTVAAPSPTDNSAELENEKEPVDPQRAAPDSSASNGNQLRSRLRYTDLDDGLAQLPSYARSLLKVRVPLVVTLASSRRPVQEVLELGPGSIIQFNKSCEEDLTLEIGGQAVADGEAVKVGDKFGLWITSMKMPGERFWAINGKRQGNRVK